jgi:hypothetical protein
MESLKSDKTVDIGNSDLNLEEFISVEELNEFEQIESMNDKWPLLALRKALWRIKSAVSRTC